MSDAFFKVPTPINEPVFDYRPGSTEAKSVAAAIKTALAKEEEIASYINGEWVKTGDVHRIAPPHDHAHTLGNYHKGNANTVKLAIKAAMAAKKNWENMAWQDRAAIFLKAADLLSGPYRDRANAVTMLGQSKNVYQSEIDAVAELCDFYRFNAAYMTELYQQQPISPARTWNRSEYRPLEGFIFALTPFNFTSIAGNLAAAPALMGNTVVWKPAESQIYSAKLLVDIMEEAGLPKGVINLVLVDGPTAGNVLFKDRDFGGLHFTGGTSTFNRIWGNIGANVGKYKSYPRIVGETGGKDFVIAHPSADADVVAVALARGAFEYQGQKCSAASRAYIPESLWPAVKERLAADLASMKMGSPEDFSNFINAVIDRKAYDKITGYIKQAKADSDAEVVIGGEFSDEKGFYIRPTVIQTTNPRYTTIQEEIFGPVLTVYVYPDKAWKQTLALVDSTSPYALTGAIFARERSVIAEASAALRHSAGNFYINDKPTGAVVGQQPFGGARASGTNDKAGSFLNLVRWTSVRSIKENFLPPTDYRYPFLG
jgi:1-pyrroline-5-carboxylate dehydrogenase